jgi:uncharacterized protein YjbJ (UPF0337 family)
MHVAQERHPSHLENGESDEKMSNKNKAKNKTQIVKGKIDEAAGRVSGNDRLEEDGKVDQMMGNVKQASENIKDAVKK